ncbi:MAG TPA: hypothetical protein VF600_08510 [Abditibacteriaceae bacterium]|jgi:hypothetical protein
MCNEGEQCRHGCKCIMADADDIDALVYELYDLTPEEIEIVNSG